MQKKIEAVEKTRRNINWRYFSNTKRGSMSWADWFRFRGHHRMTNHHTAAGLRLHQGHMGDVK
jgi:hypothetical protein